MDDLVKLFECNQGSLKRIKVESLPVFCEGRPGQLVDQVVVQRFQETLNCTFMKWLSFSSKFDSESKPKRRSLKGFGSSGA